MVRVVEQQMVTTDSLPMFADLAHQLVRVPFVNDYQTSAFQRRVQVKRLQFIPHRLQLRIDRMKFPNRLLSMFSDEVFVAPRIRGFVNRDVMTARNQFCRNPTKEVRIAVIPIRNQRVIEHDDFHAITSTDCGLASAVASRREYAAKYPSTILSGVNSNPR